MPIIIITKSSPTTKLPLFSLRCRVVKLFSSSIPAPAHHHIALLILDQNSASQALQTFRWASQLSNFNHSQSTYRALIHKLCTFRHFDSVHHLLDEMPTSIGSPPDEDIFLTIIRGLARARMTTQLVKVVGLVSRFHGKPSLKIFNAILNGLVKENIDIAREFYRKKMMATGVVGDDYTFGILMKGLCSTNRIADAFKLLQLLKSRGVTPNAVIYNTLLHALCRNGKVGRARSLINEMEKPTNVTFNVLISAYCANDNLIQALVLLDKCFSFGFVPDIVTVTKVLELLCNLGCVSEAVEILQRVESKGGIVDVVAYNTLIKGFCKLGKVKVGHRILKEMESKGCFPNVETYNVLISGFCESGSLDSALDLFNDMKTDGIKWNFATYDTLIRGLCLVGRTEDGFQILQLMEERKEGCGGQISPYNSILYGLYKQNRTDEAVEFLTNMGKLFPRVVDRSLRIFDFCKERKIRDAKIIFDRMINEGAAPSVLVYNCLIHGFCKEGCLHEAFELMNEMIGCGSSPIASTFNALICGFCSQGKTDSAIRFMEDMVGRGSVLDAGSYNPLMLGLCREGDLQKALKMFSGMIENGIIPDHFAWNSLLLCLSQQTERLGNNHMLYVNKLLDYIMET